MITILHRPQHYFVASLGLMLALAPAAAPSQLHSPDGYVGIVSDSVNHKRGAQFTFANINTSRPFVVWPGGSGSETTKVFENGEFIVLFSVASATGATETFYLTKKALRFTLVEMSFLVSPGPSGEVSPMMTYGSLK